MEKCKLCGGKIVVDKIQDHVCENDVCKTKIINVKKCEKCNEVYEILKK